MLVMVAGYPIHHSAALTIGGVIMLGLCLVLPFDKIDHYLGTNKDVAKDTN